MGFMQAPALVLVAFLSAANLAPAQASPTPPEAIIQARSNLVVLPTVVRSASGDLVHGLTAANFRVTDNGVEQKVTLESREGRPLSILVVMQTGGAARRQFADYRGLATMVGYLAGSSNYKAGALTFDSRPEDIWDLEPNARSLSGVLSNPGPGDRGAAVLDAVEYGIGILSKTPPSTRRIMLLLSQPYDEGSKARPEDVVRHLEENSITIFSLSFSPERAWLKDQFTGPRQGNPPYQLSPNLPPILYTFNLSAPLGVALKAMRKDASAAVATLSGGEHARFDDGQSLDQQLAVVANHIANRYVLSFTPSSPTAGFHSLHVEVLGQSAPLNISAREGYWFTPSDLSQ